MNMYTKLSMHLSRHMYKRGRNKGEAPADKNRRGMSYFRVVKRNDGAMCVRMHGTDLLTAHQDGSVLIDTKGWWDRQTTVLRLNDAFGFFDNLSVRMYTSRVYSYSQPILRVNGKRYRYYDGMILSEQGELLTPMQAFEMKRIDKAESKELADDIKESGFKDAFKLLYATATPEDMELDNYVLFGVHLPDVFKDTNQADKWKLVIARNKFERRYSYSSGGSYAYEERSDAKACWATLMAACKKNMYVVSRSSTYVL